jgi:hypothetical protein
METGSHENYWPYWNNFGGAIGKILKQTAPGTDAYLAIKNRLEDIHDRKTVFGFRRQIDERDLESSLGGALVHRLPFSEGSGHRVSLARESYPTAPVYEVLEVASTGLPAGHAPHAGAAVYRDTDPAGTLRFDPGGEAVPEALARHVHGRRVPPAALGGAPRRRRRFGRPQRADAQRQPGRRRVEVRRHPPQTDGDLHRVAPAAPGELHGAAQPGHAGGPVPDG